jgi:hypothetical protein
MFLIVMIVLSGFVMSFDIPKMNSWKLKGKVQSYHPGNLWELINGAADAFISFDFQELKSYDVEKGNLIFTVNIYDMGTPLNAFGMFRSENSARDDSEKPGIETQYSDYLTVMLKGSYYIKIETVKGKTTRKNCSSLLRDISKSLPGSTAYPTEISLLPVTNRIKQSARFIKENFLGIQELSNCLYAEYQNDQIKYRLFIIITTDQKNSGEFLKLLAKKWTTETLKGELIYLREIPYTGIVGITLRNNNLIGISGCKTKDAMLKLMQGVLDNK